MLTFLSVVIVVVSLLGVFNFPYVPLFFGIYGANIASVRGKITLALLKSFPVIAFVSLVTAWFVNPIAIFMPFVLTISIFVIKPRVSKNVDGSTINKDERWHRALDLLSFELKSVALEPSQIFNMHYSILFSDSSKAEGFSAKLTFDSEVVSSTTVRYLNASQIMVDVVLNNLNSDIATLKHLLHQVFEQAEQYSGVLESQSISEHPI